MRPYQLRCRSKLGKPFLRIITKKVVYKHSGKDVYKV